MEPEKQGERRRRQPKKQTRDREVGGRLGARPKEVCVQSSDTMQDSTQGLRAVTATRRCVCRGVCVQRSVCAEERHNARQRSGPEGSDGHEEVCAQRSDTTRDSTQGLRAVTDTRRCVCRGVYVQRSDTMRDSTQGLRAVTATRRWVCRGATQRETALRA